MCMQLNACMEAYFVDESNMKISMDKVYFHLVPVMYIFLFIIALCRFGRG